MIHLLHWSNLLHRIHLPTVLFILNDLDTILRLSPKGIIHKSSFNPHACATQNYSILEDLAHEPSTILSLEVLIKFPTQ
jgi:hypothetical protein